MRLCGRTAGALVRLWLALALALQVGGASAGAVPYESPALAALSGLVGAPVVLCHHDQATPEQPEPDRPTPLDDCCRHGWCQLLHVAVDLPPAASVAPRRAALRLAAVRVTAAQLPPPRRILATAPRGPPNLC